MFSVEQFGGMDSGQALTPAETAEAARHEGQHGRSCMRCAAYLRQCSQCGTWYMSTGQRDAHRAKVGH
jgi:hypothetical protein